MAAVARLAGPASHRPMRPVAAVRPGDGHHRSRPATSAVVLPPAWPRAAAGCRRAIARVRRVVAAVAVAPGWDTPSGAGRLPPALQSLARRLVSLAADARTHRFAVTLAALAVLRFFVAAGVPTPATGPGPGGVGHAGLFEVGVAPHIWSSILVQMVCFPAFGLFPPLRTAAELRKEGGTALRDWMATQSRHLSLVFAAGLATSASLGHYPLAPWSGPAELGAAIANHVCNPDVQLLVATLTAGSMSVLVLADAVGAWGLGGSGLTTLIAFSATARLAAAARQATLAGVVAGLGANPVGWLAWTGLAVCTVAATVRTVEGFCRVPVCFFRPRPRGGGGDGWGGDDGPRVMDSRPGIRDSSPGISDSSPRIGEPGGSDYLPMRALEQGTFPIMIAQDVLGVIPWALSRLGVTLPAALMAIDPGLGVAGLGLFLLGQVLKLGALGGLVYGWCTQESDRMAPKEMATYLMKLGAVIPGVPPGSPTVAFLTSTSARVRRGGGAWLAGVAVSAAVLDSGLGPLGVHSWAAGLPTPVGVTFWPVLLVVGAAAAARQQARALGAMPQLAEVQRLDLEL